MWNRKESPLRIEKRFEFDNYQKISKFMTIIDELCKTNSIYPNVSFGNNFVSFTIFLSTKEKSLKENDFSKKIDKIFEKIQK